MTVRQQVLDNLNTSSLAKYSFSQHILLSYRTKKNRFIDEWKENKYSYEFWNNIGLMTEGLLDKEKLYHLVVTMWKVWHPKTRIVNYLTKEEKGFLLQISSLERDKLHPNIHVDAESTLPNISLCLFSTLQELLYICCCCYFLDIKECKAVNIRNLSSFTLVDEIIQQPSFSKWYSNNISFSHLEKSLNRKDGDKLYLSLGFPAASTSIFVWWPIDQWMSSEPLPIHRINAWLEESGLPRSLYQKPHVFRQPRKQCSLLDHKSD